MKNIVGIVIFLVGIVLTLKSIVEINNGNFEFWFLIIVGLLVVYGGVRILKS